MQYLSDEKDTYYRGCSAPGLVEGPSADIPRTKYKRKEIPSRAVVATPPSNPKGDSHGNLDLNPIVKVRKALKMGLLDE